MIVCSDPFCRTAVSRPGKGRRRLKSHNSLCSPSHPPHQARPPRGSIYYRAESGWVMSMLAACSILQGLFPACLGLRGPLRATPAQLSAGTTETVTGGWQLTCSLRPFLDLFPGAQCPLPGTTPFFPPVSERHSAKEGRFKFLCEAKLFCFHRQLL